MAMPTKGSRQLCIDGVLYRWHARQLEPIGVRITVEKRDPAGALLLLTSAQNRAVAHVPPSQVVSLIQHAIDDGWDPHNSGPPFEMQVTFD
jgi:hypothetical protein